jgi:hypothetical protein
MKETALSDARRRELVREEGYQDLQDSLPRGTLGIVSPADLRRVEQKVRGVWVEEQEEPQMEAVLPMEGWRW